MAYNQIQMKKQGFQEKSHTADWEIEAWAVDMEGLFKQTAEGMASLSGLEIGGATNEELRYIELTARDEETLLVRFLSELLYWVENENVGFKVRRIAFHRRHLRAEIEVGPILKIDKIIKAVTWHDLVIRKSEGVFSVSIVFDV